MEKQTAVGFLIEMTSKLGYISADIAEQAKEMEKQQMIQFAYYYSNERIDLKDLNYEYEQTFGGKL
jgi:hypothetical protein